MKIEVKQHTEISDNVNHINHIVLIYQSEDVILLYIDLNTKHMKLGDGGGNRSVHSLWLGEDEILITLPGGFKADRDKGTGGYRVFFESCRYTIHVCIYKTDMLDKAVCTPSHILWESPE